VCTGYALEHVVASPVAPAGGSQGTGQDLEAGPGDMPSREGWVPVAIGKPGTLLEAADAR
jgi:hypothetical protein